MKAYYNAIWKFPHKIVAQTLARRLPEFQKRSGKYDQVSRFYIPISGSEDTLISFVNESKQWTAAERKTALAAIKSWSIEDEDWELVLEKLGKLVAKTKAESIPEHWDVSWKKRFEEGRRKRGEYSIRSIFWKKGKKEWIEDLDFLIEVLALNLGKDWRQIDIMTNALWFFAKTTVYLIFVEKLKLLPNEKQQKILANIKRVNKQKFKRLDTELNG